MKSARWALVICVLVGISGLVLTLRWMFTRSQDKQNDIVRVEEVREVPLGAIYSTSHQKGLRNIRDVLDDSARQPLEKLEEADGLGLDNIALVRGGTVGEALFGSRFAFRGGAGAGAAQLPGRPREDIWLVVYLGTASSEPPIYEVKAVAVFHDRIRFEYNLIEPGMATDDEHPYFFWAPLGALPAGPYQLEVHNATEGVVTLSRRVLVKPMPAPEQVSLGGL